MRKFDDFLILDMIRVHRKGKSVEERTQKLINFKSAAKDEVTGETVNGGGELVIDRILKMWHMAFEERCSA